ncbi:hypothetical protein A1O1_02841 [Capronia coronata CBS 617.96]|uniref:ATPase AAA-type core domain-containing protein n=1 Tax=Capronia coronata CBS 617.96 TaxID=1182541 RepID=W9YXQ5_9EURO|nr:uncharacterized protein A1O1_02841 [Capronia coronata CBS 617.96]EXJ94445.1 hypothetical protein A1O1_02841 [Capronia coronata CBS 617.96]
MNNDTCSEAIPSSPLGLDGAADDIRLRTLEETHPEARLNDCGPIATASPTISGNGSSAIAPWIAPEDDEFQYENTRRKRRKVSEEATVHDSQTLQNMDTTPNAWHEQLQEAAMSGVDRFTKEGEPHSERSAQPLPAVNADSPLDKGHTYEIGELSHKNTGGTNISDARETMSSGDSKIISSTTRPNATHALPDKETPLSTPKKATMRIDSNGKLTKSPLRSKRRSPRTKNIQVDQGVGRRNAGHSSRRMEMKNGKLVPSLQVTLFYKSAGFGKKIEEILSHPSSSSRTQVAAAQPPPAVFKDAKATHPFFLGRLASQTQKQSLAKDEQPSTTLTTDDETNQGPREAPRPWKDIKFTVQRPSQGKLVGELSPIWPPLSLQRVEPCQDMPIKPVSSPRLAQTLKAKHRVSNIRPDEDILQLFAGYVKNGCQGWISLHLPIRMIMTGKSLIAKLNLELGIQGLYADHIAPLKTLIESTTSPFDKGMAAGAQMWPQEYAPTSWQEVLQPQIQTLHDWLTTLKVHQVQNGKLPQKSKTSTIKKRRKKRSDDMDNFIVNSDDEDQAPSGKNAILITGPCGCGKTAAVFTVAQQLGFEVFEIHAGMRRSARDIQEKVGDMTQNHLVQQASSLSRGSSMSLEDSNGTALPFSEQVAPNQSTMANFMNLGKVAMSQKSGEAGANKDAKIKAQKQSLILFEEVDILFEEDKGFWSGVQSLIRTSKRPVIMTCNNPESIPLDELDLFTILTFNHSETKLSIERLGCVAAAEGHLLSKKTLEDLYLSKGQDLRASLTELNLWCQMTVGSKQGGLDWMLPQDLKRGLAQDGSVMRTVSQGTFVSGLDLYPTELDDPVDTVKFCHESLCLSPLDWVRDEFDLKGTGNARLEALDDMLLLSDSRSVMDVLDCNAACLVAGMIMKNRRHVDQQSPRDEVVRLYLEQQNRTTSLTRAAVADAMETLMEESRIGLPMSPGRKAPSLDNAAESLVTEVAPYIRSIVEHDQRLEHIRTELGGGESQIKRQRKTRASRAALEGGSKITTRRDKWFPETLDFSAVLATAGNGWPTVRPGDVEMPSTATTPASSLANEVDDGALEASK